MRKQRPVYKHLPGLGRLIPSTQRAIGCQPRKTKTKLLGSIEIVTRLSFTISLLLIQVNVRSKSPRKTNVIKETVEEAIQPLGLTTPKWQRRIRIKPKTWATSSVTPTSRKATMLTSVSKSEKASGSLGKLYVNDWKENRRKIWIDILHLISHNV